MHRHTRLRLIRRGKDVQRHNPLGGREGGWVLWGEKGWEAREGRAGTFICRVYPTCFFFLFRDLLFMNLSVCVLAAYRV